MSDQDQRNDNEPGGSPKPGQSFRSDHDDLSSLTGKDHAVHTARKYTTWVRRYLNTAEPALMMMHAMGLFVVSLFVSYFAMKALTLPIPSGNIESYQGFAFFISSLASIVRVAATGLGVWGIARLIADAISAGNTHD